MADVPMNARKKAEGYTVQYYRNKLFSNLLRWLIIDEQLYHCGHSLNANGGHKISAITLMGTSPEVILAEVE